MILTRIQLQHFRNYRKLDLELSAGSTLLYGANGAGKTNVVEAVFMLATTKSFRARTDRELIDRSFDPMDNPFPFARMQGDVESDGSRIRVEILISDQTESARKQFRLNGVPKRASDVVGQIKAVLFSPSDVEIVAGSPSARRRYMDVMLCQVDPSYLRLLQSYGRIVQQRNGVLTRLGGRSQQAMLEIWDEKLVAEGSRLMMRREEMLGKLSRIASEMYARLSNRAESFEVEYRPSFTGDGLTGSALKIAEDVERYFTQSLRSEAGRSEALRVTTVGPHRDDLSLSIDGQPLISYGSRGQQRTAALALRMAEAKYIFEATRHQPILLLDEALGELDDNRRDALLDFVREYSQVILTGTTRGAYPAMFRAEAALFEVRSGELARGEITPVEDGIHIAS